jgi:hypothetical protein
MGIVAHIKDLSKKSVKLLLLCWLWFFIQTPVFPNTVEVGGILAESTVWTAENTYIVTDNVIIFQGITLQIDAGTTVKFNQGRGLTVEGGSLLITGTSSDNVFLIPNHSGGENWNWQGITLNSVSNPAEVIIEYASIHKAVIGIKGQTSNNVRIQNSEISNSFFIGIELINSSSWEISGNRIMNNFSGIEILASGNGNQSAGNLIHGNILDNFAINISIQSNSHGACFHNTIEENTVKNASQGIWLFSTSQGVFANTHIRGNLIYNNGNENDGFGLFVAVDTTFINNNIFWKNHTAVVYNSARDSWFSFNSIYENKNGMVLRNNSQNIDISHNTITGNAGDVVSFFTFDNFLFRRNNIFRNQGDSAVIRINTPFNIDISENYWGTTVDSIIQVLFYHDPDSVQPGQFIYQPFLEDPDTLAPVSAPFRFTWQRVHGVNRFTWFENPETNLLGYRIFSGETGLYQFSDSTSLITDTVFSIPAGSAHSYVITAYKQGGTEDNFRFSGKKSPYAYGMQIPFAGNDTVICRTTSFLSLSKATAPQSNSGVFWTTSGDGNFTNPRALNPRYFPGIMDRESGEVTLRLTVFMNGKEETDELTLMLSAEPTAFAGYDEYLPSGSPYFTQYASAIDYDALLWQTTGDGVFENPDLLLTYYFPGNHDMENGEVQLILHALSDYCVSASDTLTLFIRTAFSINGRLWKDNLPAAEYPVIAFLKTEDDAPDIPSRHLTFSDTNGQFQFSNLVEGNYLLFMPSDTSNPTGHLPTYYAAQSRWQNAFQLVLNGDIFEVDLHLLSNQYQIPSGNGSIAGHFQMPQISGAEKDVLCTGWFGDQNSEFCLQGLSNAGVLLFSLSRQVIYVHKLTDANGNFRFRDLPYGVYYLEAELAGYHSAVSEQIIISPQQQTVESIQLGIDSKNIRIFLPENILKASEPVFYPNPVQDHLNVQYYHFQDDKPVSYIIFDMNGRKIAEGHVLPLGGQVKIDVRNLLPDLYVIRTGTIEKKHSFIFKKY